MVKYYQVGGGHGPWSCREGRGFLLQPFPPLSQCVITWVSSLQGWSWLIQYPRPKSINSLMYSWTNDWANQSRAGIFLLTERRDAPSSFPPSLLLSIPPPLPPLPLTPPTSVLSLSLHIFPLLLFLLLSLLLSLLLLYRSRWLPMKKCM